MLYFKRLSLLLVFATIYVIHIPQINANIIYVNPNGDNSDGFTENWATAFSDLANAIASASPADTIYIMANNRGEEITLIPDNTININVPNLTIMSRPGDKAVIDGTTVSEMDISLFFINADGLILQDFTIRNYYANAWRGPRGSSAIFYMPANLFDNLTLRNINFSGIHNKTGWDVVIFTQDSYGDYVSTIIMEGLRTIDPIILDMGNFSLCCRTDTFIMRNCYFEVDATASQGGIGCDYVLYSYFENNIFKTTTDENSGYTRINFGGNAYVDEHTYICKAYNNTLINCFSTIGYAVEVEFINNIIMYNTEAELNFPEVLLYEITYCATLLMYNNLFYYLPSSEPSTVLDASYIDIRNEIMGQDPQISLLTYEPQAGSPCIDAGYDTYSTPMTDFYGNLRSKPVDIGAVEGVSETEKMYVKDEILVKFKEQSIEIHGETQYILIGPSKEDIENFNNLQGCEVKYYDPVLKFYQLKIPANKTVEEMI
ncbi:MAG: choice-of-anchor Q domain-containing protein, partial [Candidatus Hydrogenedentota bacterium]